MNDGRLFVALGAAAVLLGLRGSIRLHRRYVDVRDQLIDRERWLLAAIVTVAWLVTIVGGYLVVMTGRRLFGLPAFDWAPIVTILCAEAILLIPAFLDWVVTRVARVPWR